jgi:hypothetical protein
MNLRHAQALQIASRETPTGFDQIPSMKYAARSNVLLTGVFALRARVVFNDRTQEIHHG